MTSTKFTWADADVVLFPRFGYTADGDWAWFDRNGHPHLPGTVAFGAACIGMSDRFNDDTATDADYDALAEWPESDCS